MVLVCSSARTVQSDGGVLQKLILDPTVGGESISQNFPNGAALPSAPSSCIDPKCGNLPEVVLDRASVDVW